MTNKIVLDLETQKDFSEVGGRSGYKNLRVSVCGVYSYPEDKYYCFGERELAKLGEMLQVADQVIGYNIRQFDYEVLQPYLNFSLETIPTLDILAEIESVLGHRIRLEAIAQATLGVGKTGTGRAAIDLWKHGRLEELKSYCLNDVKLTREVYDYGQQHGKLLFQDFFETREIVVNFPEPLPRLNVVQQTSLF